MPQAPHGVPWGLYGLMVEPLYHR